MHNDIACLSQVRQGPLRCAEVCQVSGVLFLRAADMTDWLITLLGVTQISYLHHLERVKPEVKRPNEKIAYYRIAAHYKFILKTFFDCFSYPRLIILEARPHLLSVEQQADQAPRAGVILAYQIT